MDEALDRTGAPCGLEEMAEIVDIGGTERRPAPPIGRQAGAVVDYPNAGHRARQPGSVVERAAHRLDAAGIGSESEMAARA